MQPIREENQPRISFKMDRQLIWHRGESVRFAVVEVAAPPKPPRIVNRERIPLNLGIVIDRSGSMSGTPLEEAKGATCQIIDGLENGDRFSVVTFESEVQTVVNGAIISEDNKTKLQRQVMAISSGGCTDLSGGWMQGAECVATGMGSDSPSYRNQVMLLSDGHANRGIVDTSVLTQHAAGLLEQGVTTTCIGIGDGYSLDQVQALARGGGGRLHDAAVADEISSAMLGDLGEAQNAMLENVTVELEMPGVSEVSCVGNYPSIRNQWQLGSMRGDTTRKIIFKLKFNAGTPGHGLNGRAIVRAKNCASGELINNESSDVIVTLATGTDNNAQRVDMGVVEIVAEAWHAQIIDTATNMNRDYDYHGALETVKRQMRFFKRYVKGLPKGEEYLSDLMRFREAVRHEIPERTRKDIQMGLHKMVCAEAEYKVQAMKDAWRENY